MQLLPNLETYRDRSKKYKQRFCELMFNFMIASKKEDIEGYVQGYWKNIDNRYLW